MTTLSELDAKYLIDPTHTYVGFVVRHAMITKVRGSFASSGEAELHGADPAASSIQVSLDVNTVDTGNADRDAHLKSGDFFDAATYPAITFASTSVAVTSENTVDVTGDLTIKDVTKQVVLPMTFTGAAVDPFGNERVGFEGELEVKRSEWNLTWNAALEAGGVLVSENVKLELEASLIKQA